MSSTTVRFDAGGGNTVDLNGPDSPVEVSLLPRFVTDLSASLQRWTYQTTDTKRWHVTLQFSNLTTAQRNSLETFFSDTVSGPNSTFSYRHTDGTTYTGCRFLDTSLSFSRLDDKWWACTLRLEFTNPFNS